MPPPRMPTNTMKMRRIPRPGDSRRGAALMARAAVFLALLPPLIAATLPGQPLLAQPATETPGPVDDPPASAAGPVILLDIDGAIGPATALYVTRGIAVAEARDAALLVLQMDTPGGLDTAMRDIIRAILATPIPVATYVAPSGARAASAGTYILYASDLAAMAPGTNLGAATPVPLGGGGRPLPGAPEGDSGAGDAADRDEAPPGDAAAPADAGAAKAVNDAAAYIRSLAMLHGRDADWAEAAVRGAASLAAEEALARGVIEIMAADLETLLAQADGRIVRAGGTAVVLTTEGAAVERVEPDWRVRLLAVMTDPNIAYILMLIGIYGILYEFISPGTVISGVVGVIALLMALFALNLLPVSYAGAGLLFFGVMLMISEAFAPSFGILGIGGAIAFALGSLLLFEEVPGFTLSLPVVLTATALSAALLFLAVAAALRAHRRRPVTGDDGMIGAAGRVLSWHGDTGEVEVLGERWHAVATGPIPPGSLIRVRARSGLSLTVDPDPSPPPPAAPPPG